MPLIAFKHHRHTRTALLLAAENSIDKALQWRSEFLTNALTQFALKVRSTQIKTGDKNRYSYGTYIKISSLCAYISNIRSPATSGIGRSSGIGRRDVAFLLKGSGHVELPGIIVSAGSMVKMEKGESPLSSSFDSSR